MQENKGIKKYVLTRQSHFGYTKQSYMGGTIITVNFDEGSYSANGATFNDLRDVSIAIRAGFLDQFSEGKKKKIDKTIKEQEERHNKIVESKKEKLPKMEVVRSDEDLIEPIAIKSKEEKQKEKSDKMEIISENSDDTARGMTVVRSQPQNDDIGESSQGTVVAVIGGNSVTKSSSKTAKTAKRKTKDSEEKAKKTAEKRKADALKKREALKAAEEK